MATTLPHVMADGEAALRTDEWVAKVHCTRPAHGGATQLYRATCTTAQQLARALGEITTALGSGDGLLPAQCDGEYFLWVDVHGVPPPQPATADGTAPAPPLHALWRCMRLAEPQVAELDAVGCAFRTDAPAMALDNLYREDTRAEHPDTARVRPTQRPGDAAVLCEMAVLLGKQPTCGHAAHNARGEEGSDTTTDRTDSSVFNGSKTEGWVTYTATGREGAAETRPCVGGSIFSGLSAGIHREEQECPYRPSPATQQWKGAHIEAAEAVLAWPDDDVDDDDDEEEEGEWTGHRGRQVGLYDDADGRARAAPPLITALHLVALPNACVTWCPASDGRTAQPEGWRRMEAAVAARMRHGSQCPQSTPPTTAEFAALVLATVCYAYLPDTTAVLSEVDAIDAMLPLIVPDEESDQADALRRVLVLRRRLAVHRRLLYQKMRLLEELQRPVMRTIAAFMNPHDVIAVFPVSRGQCEGTVPLTFAAIRAAVLEGFGKLDSARVVLGNTTLVYTSTVTYRHAQASVFTDYFQLAISYMLAIVVPLTIVVSMMAFNCNVPFRGSESCAPFFIIGGTVAVLGVAALVVPAYAYYTDKLL